MKKITLFLIMLLWLIQGVYAVDPLSSLLNSFLDNSSKANSKKVSANSNSHVNPFDIIPPSSSLSNKSKDNANRQQGIFHGVAWINDTVVDNTVYNVFGYVKWDYVYVYYIPWKWVKNVTIFYSYDNNNYTKLITLSTDKKYYYFPVDFSKKNIYIKVLPIDNNWIYWVMKEWVQIIPYISISLEKKVLSEKKVGHTKTWPEMWILFVLTIFVYLFYRYKVYKNM